MGHVKAHLSGALDPTVSRATRLSWTFGKPVAIRPSVTRLGLKRPSVKVSTEVWQVWGLVRTVEKLSHKSGKKNNHQRYYNSHWSPIMIICYIFWSEWFIMQSIVQASIFAIFINPNLFSPRPTELVDDPTRPAVVFFNSEGGPQQVVNVGL